MFAQLPNIPAPTMPPEPAWIAPLQVETGYVQKPVPQSVAAPIMQGISGAASSLVSAFGSLPKQDNNKFAFPQTTQMAQVRSLGQTAANNVAKIFNPE
jgi:hypothetical protein